MILSTALAFHVLIGNQVVPQKPNLLYLGLSSPSPELVDLFAKGKISEESCARLDLELAEVGEDTFVWDKDIYDSTEGGQRLSLWTKLAQGDLKVGDVVNLGEYYGSVSGSHGQLDGTFGITEKNSNSVQAAVGNLKTVTLEAADGSQQSFVIPQSYEIDMMNLEMVKPFKPLDMGNQNGPPPKLRGISNHVRLESLGHWEDPLDKFSAGERFLRYLHGKQKEEQAQLEQLVSEWEKHQENLRASGGALPTDVSESDQHYLDSVLQRHGGVAKWKPYKVVKADLTPFLTIRVFQKDDPDGYSTVSPYMPVDRPAPPRKNEIQPE